jgi:hypothetical protein
MKRKRSQILFNFLPSDTFDHADNGTIGRVSSIVPDDETDVEGLPKHYILSRIRPQTDSWDRAPDYRASDVRLIAPGDVRFEIFPVTFECSRCRVVTQINREDLRRDDYEPACQSCGKWFRDTEQLQLVAICKCGKLDSLQVPSHCADKGARLTRQGSSLADARWVCECGRIIESPYDAQGHCGACGSLEITVHSASKTFYPHREEFVNLLSDDIDAIRSSEHFRIETVADHLADTVGDRADTDDGPDALTQQALEQLDPETRKRVEQARQETAEAQRERLEGKKTFLRETFDEDQLRSIAEEVFEYDSILQEGVYSETLAELADEARSRRDLNAPTIDRYVDRSRDLNFAEVRLIENFPITTAVYGYSRVTPESEDGVRLQPFHSESEDRRRDEVYVQNSEAEAIMLTLDHEAVFEWLDRNIEDLDAPDDDLREWALETLTPSSDDPIYPRFSPINRTEPERLVLSLVHTLSHLVLNTMDALSGYAGDSLVEYTFPRSLSFVVYKRSQTDFSLGSMFTMVENRFDQICDYLSDEARTCMYDPLCEREENSACEGCLYISGRSCSHGNHNLGRSVVYGGEFDDDRIETGFFDV